MTDNLFDRLADLFRSPGPVNWRLAREIAESAAGPSEPIEPWLDEEYRDLAVTAARHVDARSPLDALAQTGAMRVVDRRSWASMAPESLAYLAEPLAGKLTGTAPTPEIFAALGPALVGLQVGGMTGAMSQRVLGGFDVGLPPGRAESPVLIVPNLERFSSEHGLDHRQVRLWAAVHEITYAAALADPAIRGHATGLMTAFVESLEIDEAAIAERMQVLADPEALQRMAEGGDGMPPLLAATGGRRQLDDLRTLMAVIEGYADHLVDGTVGDLLPQVGMLREAIDRRRAEPGPGEHLLTQMIGLDLEHARYRRGADFCREVARRWGPDAVHRLWEAPETLPVAGDLEDPVAWAARVLL